MVYHLRNNELIRDIIASGPEFAGAIFTDAMKEMNIRAELSRQEMGNLLAPCGNTNTKIGLEMCIIPAREDMSSEFRHDAYSQKFDDVLKKVDEIVDEYKCDWYERHVL